MKMPGYEVSLVLRTMNRPELKAALHRSVATILENGGVVRKIENLGFRDIAYRMANHNQSFTQAHYFVIEFDAPSSLLETVKVYYKRDLDILRHRVLNRETLLPKERECEGVYSSLYMPPMKDFKKFKPEIKEKLKNIKLR